jgi:hypothetical protein
VGDAEHLIVPLLATSKGSRVLPPIKRRLEGEAKLPSPDRGQRIIVVPNVSKVETTGSDPSLHVWIVKFDDLAKALNLPRSTATVVTETNRAPTSK